jgi:phosphoribosylformylglycinamidine cyclo-ligase
MYRTFNMGMGYAIIAPEENIPDIVREVPDASVVGSIVRDPGISLNGIPFS